MTIWRMRIACCIPKATNTHSQYVIITAFHCNSGCTNAPQRYDKQTDIHCLSWFHSFNPTRQQTCHCRCAHAACNVTVLTATWLFGRWSNSVMLLRTAHRKMCSAVCTLRLKCDDTRTQNRFRLSAKRTSPFKSAGGRQFSRLLAAEVCASAVVMLDTPCCEVVWRVLATHSIRQFLLNFPSRASPCAITFQLDTTSSAIRTNASSSATSFLCNAVRPMRRITTFRLTTDRIYDGGPLRL